MNNQLQFITPEPLTKYLINYRGKDFECWYNKLGFVTDNYSVLEEDKVKIIQRIGTPEEVFQLV